MSKRSMSAPSPERAAFEAWCDERWGNCAYLRKSGTCGEWTAWQAARRQALEDVLQLVENWPRGAGPHSNLPNAIRALMEKP